MKVWVPDVSLSPRLRFGPWMEVWLPGWKSGIQLEGLELEGGLGPGMAVWAPDEGLRLE